MNTSPNWFAALARCTSDDLRRVSRLVDLLITARRASAETARVMLVAIPPPETHEEARLRCERIIAYLQHAEADDDREAAGREADGLPPASAWLNGAMTDQPPAPDELGDAREGVRWWNGLTPTARRFWLEHASSARPAAAYAAFKRSSEARVSAERR